MRHRSTDDILVDLLRNAETIAVIGASPKAERPSHQVMEYLINAGYRVIPVNPGQAGKEILGETVVAQLSDIDEPIDIVDIFRRAEVVLEPVEAAIEAGAGAVWLQLGISNDDATAKARGAGLVAIQNKCIKIEHARLADRINIDEDD
jgi:predicted CoA-binding protein